MNVTGSEAWFSATEMRLPGQGGDTAGRILRGPFEGVDYAAERPFIQWTGKQLVGVAERALDRAWPALELATLLYDESRFRKVRTRARVDWVFASKGLEPIAWLTEARKICSAIPVEAPPRCNGAVYAVLIRPTGNEGYSVYVGSTSLTRYGGCLDRQSARIAQHFEGGRRAARRVGRRGIEPLWSLNHFFRRVSGQGARLTGLETEVHRALEACGMRVYGDIRD